MVDLLAEPQSTDEHYLAVVEAMDRERPEAVAAFLPCLRYTNPGLR